MSLFVIAADAYTHSMHIHTTHSIHIPFSVPCNQYKFERCDVHDYVTIATDDVSYVDAMATIVTTVDSNATSSTNHTHLWYKLCYRSFLDWSEEGGEVVECVSNGTQMTTRYRWRESGEAVLTVYVYTTASYNDSDFLDCAIAKVTVASE